MAAPTPTRIQHRFGTISDWAANSSVILARGEEVCVLYDNSGATYGPLAGTVRGIKMGDGITPFSLLPYQGEYPIFANGRNMRDLSGYGTLANPVAGSDFTSTHEAMVRFLFPYTAPAFSFDGSGNNVLAVGSVNPVTLLLHNISHGDELLREKRITDLDFNTALQVVAPTSGASTVDDSPVTAQVSLSRSTSGYRAFRGTVTNVRGGAQGNDVVSHDYAYQFRYPVAFGFTKQDPRGLSEAQLSTLIFGVGSAFGRNLNGTSQRLAGSPDGDYAVFVIPSEYGALSGIFQNGLSTPLLGTFDILARNLSQAPVGGTAGTFTNVPYRVYAQKNVSGTGAPGYYDAN